MFQLYTIYMVRNGTLLSKAVDSRKCRNMDTSIQHIVNVMLRTVNLVVGTIVRKLIELCLYYIALHDNISLILPYMKI